MPRLTPLLLNAVLATGLGLSTAAHCDDLDALALQTEPAVQNSGDTTLRLALELALGRIDQRDRVDSTNLRRASLDLRYAGRLTDRWRLSFSDRIDHTHPVLGDQPKTVNSLREAYLGWQADAGSVAVDFGRINHRQGPAFGYNPTDYFRRGSLRTVTTADPVALREMRMGAVMLRANQLLAEGGVTLALAPKLESRSSRDPASLDLGATNATNRAVLSHDVRFSERISGQGSLLLEQDGSRFGASVTALATDSLVAYAEWSYGKTPNLLDQVLATSKPAIRAHQTAFGMTYTLPGSLALTVEAESNGAGLDRNGWNSVLSQGATAYQRYLEPTQTSQELGSRRAWLLYASKKGLITNQLDLTAFVRTNAIDHSRLVWTELRYHWSRFDAALQWQRSWGDPGTEFDVLPYRKVIQLVAVFYM